MLPLARDRFCTFHEGGNGCDRPRLRTNSDIARGTGHGTGHTCVGQAPYGLFSGGPVDGPATGTGPHQFFTLRRVWICRKW